MPGTTQRHSAVISALDHAATDIGLFDSEREFDNDVLIRDLRRRGRGDVADPVGTLTLIDEDGVLYWRDGSVRPAAAARRSREAAGRYVSGEIVTQRRFEMVAPDQVNSALQKLDDRFHAHVGCGNIRTAY